MRLTQKAPITFTADNLDNRTNRLDAHYFDPRYFEVIQKLQKISDEPCMKISSLSELLDTSSETCLTGGATPKGAVYVSEGIKFIRVQNVKEGHLDLDNVVFINPETHEKELNRSKLKPKDVILTITGSYGNSCVIPENIGDANINQHCVKIEINRGLINPYYLSYFLNSQLCRHQMNRAVTGSSRPALDYPVIKSLIVVYPKLNEQQKVIKSIRKIEFEVIKRLKNARDIIRKDNEIVLKKLKIQLPPKPKIRHFKVPFEKIKDRLDAITYNPEYEALINSLEKAPYKPKMLSPKLAKINTEVIIPINQKEKLFKYVELDDVNGELGEIQTFKKCYGVELQAPKVLFHKGDILLSRLRYYLKKVVLVPPTLGEGLGSAEFYTIKCSKKVNPFYIAIILRHKIVLKQAEHKATGSSRPRLTKKDIEKFLVPCPPLKVQNNIARTIDKVYLKAKLLRREALEFSNSARLKLDEYLKSQL